MPVTLPDNLPAIDILKEENIFVMTQLRAKGQDIRPLRILILNLMPVKITTETDFIRLLSNTPLQIEVDFLKLSTHQSKNTSPKHLDTFYRNFNAVCQSNYDGFIVTGAPVEMLDFEEVDYWPEISKIFDWAKNHVTSTFYICWAAQAALYYNYRIPKHILPQKLFGVFEHSVKDKKNLLCRGFDDLFYAPHSRHTQVRSADLTAHPDLTVVAESDKAGLYIAMGRNGREFYVTGHSEYPLYTLHNEYVRDIAKGISINIPENYYPNNDPALTPISRWVAHGNLLFNNWVNYFVYQETPFDLKDIGNLDK